MTYLCAQQALLHRSAGPHAAGAAAALRVRGLPHLLPRRGQPAEQHGAGEGAPLAGARHRLQRLDAGVHARKLRYQFLDPVGSLVSTLLVSGSLSHFCLNL